MSEWAISRRSLLTSAMALIGAGCRSSRSPSEFAALSAADSGDRCPSLTANPSDGWGSVSPKELQGANVHEAPRGLASFSWEGTGVPELLPRPNARQIDPSKMQLAYQSLVDGSSAFTPKSIDSQAYVHLIYCHGNHSIHLLGNFFLAWHRAAMFFHERLIQWVLKDTSFRLPYWEPSRNFGIYGSGALNHPRGINSEIPVLPKSLLQIEGFSSAAAAILDWHGKVHKAVCGDFGKIAQAGLDPLFYGFHTFVDRVWEASQVKGQMEPGSGWGLFFNPYQWNQNLRDRESGWVWVDLTKFKDPSAWGYRYDPPLSPDTLAEPPGLIFRDIPLGHRSPETYTISARPKSGGKAIALAVLEPFGRHQDPYRRLDMDQTRVDELLNGSWDFVVTPAQQSVPITTLGYNQVVRAR